MKRYLVLMSLFLGLVGFAHARTGYDFNGDGIDQDQYVSGAIYKSTNTAATTAITDVVISSKTGIALGRVIIGVPGTASFLEIFNGEVSTSAATRIARIDTTSKQNFMYDLFLSSGLMIYNYGTTPADITISYLENR